MTGKASWESFRETHPHLSIFYFSENEIKSTFFYDTTLPGCIGRLVKHEGFAYSWLGPNGYYRTSMHGKQLLCHHVVLVLHGILPDPIEEEVDHIDRVRSNNTVQNLRWVTKTENGWNRSFVNTRRSFSGRRMHAKFDMVTRKYRSEWKHPETSKLFFVGFYDTEDEASFWAKVSMAEHLSYF